MINNALFAPPKKPDSWFIEGKYKFNSHKYIPYYTIDTDIEDEEADLFVKIFFSHGNGDDLYTIKKPLDSLINDYLPKVIGGKKVKFYLQTWDYPFYGESPKPRSELTEKSVYNDAAEIYEDFLKIKPDIDIPTITIIMGFSLGCAPSIKLDAYYKADILFLVAPFKSAFYVAGMSVSVVSMIGVKDRFMNYKFLHKRKDRHLTVIQSKDDDVINYERNSDIFIKLSDNYKCLSGVKHNEFFTKKMLKTFAQIIEDDIQSVLYEKVVKNKFKEDEKIY